MIAIAAVTASWGIGKDGDLPFRLKGDMKHFRELTAGGTVIMGRKTLDSLPGGKPLPKRRNIVITRDPDFFREGVEAACSIEEAVTMTAGDEKVWVCGGGEIYRAMLPLCDRASITHVEADPDCDTFFPDLTADPRWVLESREPTIAEGETTYYFAEYVRR